MSKPSSTPPLFHGTPFDCTQFLNLPQKESHPGSGRVIFATPDVMCALAYSLKAPYKSQEKAQMYGLRIFTGEKKPPIAILGTSDGDIEKKFANLGNGFLLEVENKNFVPFDHNVKTCEWKSYQPAEIKLKHQISSKDAMRFGVQIFLIKDLNKYNSASPRERNNLKDAVEQGILMHVNQEIKLNPMNLENSELEDKRFIDNPDLIFTSLSSQKLDDGFVKKLASEKQNQQVESWVDRMRKDPTEGKSLGGSNEL